MKDLRSRRSGLVVMLVLVSWFAPRIAAAVPLIGNLAVTPTTVNFGNVQVGSSSTQVLTFANTGTGKLAIIQIGLSSSSFHVSGATFPIILPPNQSTIFNLTFTPTAAGLVNSTMTVNTVTFVSSTGTRTYAPVSVSVSGMGTLPGVLAANPSSVSFGTLQVGTSQSQSVTLTNTGGSSLTVNQAAATGAGFSVNGLNVPLTLAAGQSTTFNAVFAPQTAGSASGNLAIGSTASNSTLNIALSGYATTPGTVSANPSSMNFGSVQVGKSVLLSETLTNSGGSTVTVTQAPVTGAGFTASGLSLPLTLTAGQSFTFGVTFAPTSAGSANGSIAVTSDASDPNLTISLSGTGTASGQLTVSPANLSFGSVTVGQSKSLTGTLSASGSSVTVSSATVGTSEFAISGITLPLTLTAGQNATFTVTFTPQASGAASDTASFASNASNTPGVQALTGTGVAPPQHSVSLSWNTDSSPVVGYNVYRGPKSGGPYNKINSALNGSTSYIDSSVSAGQIYFYVSTGVNAGGQESGYSNEVQAVIPTP